MSVWNKFPVVCVQCSSCGYLFKGVIFKVFRSAGVLISFGNNALFSFPTDISFNKYHFLYLVFVILLKQGVTCLPVACDVYFTRLFPCSFSLFSSFFFFYITWNSFKIFLPA